MMSWPAHCIGRSAGAEIVSVLKSLLPDFEILDTSYPMLTFSWVHDQVTAVFQPERVPHPAELQFYSRFLQAGGHMPLLRLPDLAAHNSARSGKAAQTDRTTVVACHASDCPTLMPYLTDASPATMLLVNDPELDQTTSDELTRAGFAGRLTVRFHRKDAIETFRLLGRKTFGAQAVDNVLRAAKGYAIDVSLDSLGFDSAEPLIWVELPLHGYRPPTAALIPRRLIHDGSRKSEGTEDYSWLWIGEERHIRILLGRVPDHFRRVRVIVANAISTDNLKTARLALNGNLVEPVVEIWSEGSGAVSTDLPQDFGGDQVLGFSVSHTKAMEDGASALSACIDRVELQA